MAGYVGWLCADAGLFFSEFLGGMGQVFLCWRDGLLSGCVGEHQS